MVFMRDILKMNKKLAILAGGGKFPDLAIKTALEKKYTVYVVGFTNFFDKKILKKYKNIKFYDYHIGHIKKYLKVLKKESITNALFIGKIYKHLVFKEKKIDLLAIKLLLSLKDRTDFSILSKFVEVFNKAGVKVLSQKDFFFDILYPKGYLTKTKIKKNITKNIEWSYKLAKSVANLDIGQSIIVNNKTVISVEGIEGTDKMIQRSNEFIFEKNKAIFIKVARKHFDPRFDLPTVGLNTLKLINKVGIKNIIVESKTVLMPKLDKIIKFSDKNKIAILGI